MTKLPAIAALAALAACAQPEPIIDYGAPLAGKYTAPATSPRPKPRPAVRLKWCQGLVMRIPTSEWTEARCRDGDTPISKPHKPKDPSKGYCPPKPKGKPKGNNGWGNGSQPAPGHSGAHNNAENGPAGKDNGKGKASGNSGKGKGGKK